jgi:hypothetical protein
MPRRSIDGFPHPGILGLALVALAACAHPASQPSGTPPPPPPPGGAPPAAKRTPPPPPPARKSVTPAATPAAGAAPTSYKKVGIPECDALLEMYRCVADKTTGPSKQAIEQGLQAFGQGLSQALAAGSAAVGPVSQACQQAHTAMKQAWAVNSQYKGCFP